MTKLVRLKLTAFLVFTISCASQQVDLRSYNCKNTFSKGKGRGLSSTCKKKTSEQHDIGQEIELKRDKRLLNILKLKNDDLSFLLADPEIYNLLNKSSSFLFDREKKNKNLKNMKWLDIPYKVRNKVLGILSRKVDFDKDRSIPGLIVNTKLNIVAVRDFQLLGKNYLKGEKYELNLDGFLNEVIEYATADSVKGATYVEMHFRGKNTRQLNKDISVFFNIVLPSVAGEKELKLLSSHQHIIGKAPEAFFKEQNNLGHSNELIALGYALTHQMYEMGLILLSISKLTYFPYTNEVMDHLKSDKIGGIFDFFKYMAGGKVINLGTRYKQNNIGVRSGSVLSDLGLWSFEFRFPGFVTTIKNKEFSDLSQFAYDNMNEGKIPINMEALAEFIKEYKLDPREVATNSWWVQDINALRDSHKNGYLNQSKVNELFDTLKSYYKLRKEVPFTSVDVDDPKIMLAFIFYRWDKHPLFYKQSELLASIQKMQEDFLVELTDKNDILRIGDEKLNNIVKAMLIRFLYTEEVNIYSSIKNFLKLGQP